MGGHVKVEKRNFEPLGNMLSFHAENGYEMSIIIRNDKPGFCWVTIYSADGKTLLNDELVHIFELATTAKAFFDDQGEVWAYAAN
jgi:hypothetical protein